MAFDVLYAWLPANLVNTGTLTLSYPAGRSASSYSATGHQMAVSALQAVLNADADDFDVEFGVSNIVVTYKRSTVIPKGSEVIFQFTSSVDTSTVAASAAAAAASASAAALSASAASTSETNAAASEEAADSAADAASTSATAAANSAASALSQVAACEAVLGNCEDVLSDIEAITSDFLDYGLAAAVTSSRDFASTDLAKDLEFDLVTAGGDITIDLPKDVYTDANTAKRKAVNCIVNRGGTSRKVVFRPKVSAASAAPAIIANGSYATRDNDTTANTSGDLYTAALPTQTLTNVPAGDDRMLVVFVAFSYQQSSSPPSNPSVSATVDSLAATVIKNFNNPINAGPQVNVAALYYPLGSSASPTTHSLSVSVGVAHGRASQIISWAVFEDAKQTSPTESLFTLNDGLTNALTDGSDNEWKNELTVTTVTNYCQVVSFHVWDRGLSGTQTVETGTEVNKGDTGFTSSRDMTWATVRSAKNTAGSVTHKVTVSKTTDASTTLVSQIGFGLLPVGGTTDVTLLDDTGTSQASINVTNDVVLRAHANGTTYRIMGA